MSDRDDTKLVEVELHSTEPSAVSATRATIAALPGAGPGLVEKGGRYYVAAGFIAFACEKQGYVKRVVRS